MLEYAVDCWGMSRVAGVCHGFGGMSRVSHGCWDGSRVSGTCHGCRHVTGFGACRWCHVGHVTGVRACHMGVGACHGCPEHVMGVR